MLKQKFINNASDNRFLELGRLIIKIVNITCNKQCSVGESKPGGGMQVFLEGFEAGACKNP